MYPPDPSNPTPPILPPKPGSHETSRHSTPAGPLPQHAGPALPPPPLDFRQQQQQQQQQQQYEMMASGMEAQGQMGYLQPGGYAQRQGQGQEQYQAREEADPGEFWVPEYILDKSKQDIAAILASPSLLSSLTHSPSHTHPSLTASTANLTTAISSNLSLATHISTLQGQLSSLRASTQAQLLSTQTLERQWRAKQTEMDHALEPFAPASLYQRLGQGVGEQAGVCAAMEESFLDGEGIEGERDVGDWVKKYRDARVQFYLRQERKERWDEGRVGGWR